MLENICAMGQCSDTSVRDPLPDLVLLFAQLVHFSFCYNLVLAEPGIQSILSLRLRDLLALSGTLACAYARAHLLCIYVYLPGVQTELVKFKIAATVPAHKM